MLIGSLVLAGGSIGRVEIFTLEYVIIGTAVLIGIINREQENRFGHRLHHIGWSSLQWVK